MPNKQAAKKALRNAARKHVFNMRRKRTMKEAVKNVRRAIKTDPKEAKAGLNVAYKAIDKSVKSGVLKKNTAARMKSRLSKELKQASA